LVATSHDQAFGTNSEVVVNSGGVLAISGFSHNVATLTQTAATGGQVNIGAGSTLNINNANGTFSGTFTGTGTLGKLGTGTLTLTGSSPGFTGTNKIFGGSEIVNGSLGGSVLLFNGATLGGGGTVGTIKTSSTSEKVNPGPVGATGVL